MSKKVISILLSAAMLVAMLCVGVGAVTASADTVTYYFLAPDEYFATNNSVGYYYWSPEENGPWPGLEMTPAPEVGDNVFKCEAPDMDSTSTIIFNAFVDAGTPADPELAAYAHQTINVNTEGYVTGESAVYDELGMELEIVDMEFDSIITAVMEGPGSAAQNCCQSWRDDFSGKTLHPRWSWLRNTNARRWPSR